jgi:hypothetical protein
MKKGANSWDNQRSGCKQFVGSLFVGFYRRVCVINDCVGSGCTVNSQVESGTSSNYASAMD